MPRANTRAAAQAVIAAAQARNPNANDVNAPTNPNGPQGLNVQADAQAPQGGDAAGNPVELLAIRQALVRLGFSAHAAVELVENQGLGDLEVIKEMTDDEIETLCRLLRRPGGTVANPAQGPNAPDRIPNPGMPVACLAETNLKLLRYYLRHLVRISRTARAEDITREKIRALSGLREWESNYSEPDAPEGLINPKDWVRTFEAIHEFLRTQLGTTGIPLAYVIRKDVSTKDEGNDPTFPSGYFTHQDEMIARAPIEANGQYTPTFVHDNQRVWDILAPLVRDELCWEYAKQGQRARDGRKAFMAMYDHYLGPNNANAQANEAEKELHNAAYTGEKRRWNFERYISHHLSQHNILARLKDEGLHPGLNERSKVRLLIDGIKTDALDSVTSAIMISPDLMNDFARTSRLYLDFIAARRTKTSQGKREFNISGVGAGKVTVRDRYYKPSEYSKLTPEQKSELKRIRDERKKKGSKGKKGNDTSKELKKLTRKVAELASRMPGEDGDTTPTAEDTDDTSISSKASTSSKMSSNSTNAALTRQPRKKVKFN